MANFIANENAAFDINNIDLNYYSRYMTSATIQNDTNYTANGQTFQDVVTIYAGPSDDKHAITFGGTDITVNADGVITGGTVTGIQEYSSKLGDALWFIGHISTPAAPLYQALLTVGNTDDLSILANVLRGDDTFTMSNLDDVITGYDGNDTFQGMSGNDQISGGNGNDTIYGGDGNDTLIGGAGRDAIFGGAGDDIIYATGDGDTIDGGAGFDQVIYTGLARGYGVTSANGSATIAADHVTGVENIVFQDATLTFDENSDAAFVMRMYDTVLRRTPDPTGFDWWLDAMSHGATREQVASSFLGSPEFASATGTLSTPDFVEYLYNHALGRTSDAAGKAFWIDYINSGTSRAEVLIGFSESAEHRLLTADTLSQGLWITDENFQQVEALYDAFANRLPDSAGLVAWVDQINAGMTLGQVADAFAASPEFASHTAGLSNADLVEYMYENTLDRAADSAGKQFWVDQLNHGMSKGELLLDFSASPEHFWMLRDHLYAGVDVLL
jgi:hypothetical protein